MIARACEWNPSVFRNNGEKDDIFDVSIMGAFSVCRPLTKLSNKAPSERSKQCIKIVKISGCS